MLRLVGAHSSEGLNDITINVINDSNVNELCGRSWIFSITFSYLRNSFVRTLKT